MLPQEARPPFLQDIDGEGNLYLRTTNTSDVYSVAPATGLAHHIPVRGTYIRVDPFGHLWFSGNTLLEVTRDGYVLNEFTPRIAGPPTFESAHVLWYPSFNNDDFIPLTRITTAGTVLFSVLVDFGSPENYPYIAFVPPAPKGPLPTSSPTAPPTPSLTATSTPSSTWTASSTPTESPTASPVPATKTETPPELPADVGGCHVDHGTTASAFLMLSILLLAVGRWRRDSRPPPRGAQPG